MPGKGVHQESTASSCVDDEGGVARAQEIVPVCHTGGLPLGSPVGDGAGLEKLLGGRTVQAKAFALQNKQ